MTVQRFRNSEPSKNPYSLQRSGKKRSLVPYIRIWDQADLAANVPDSSTKKQSRTYRHSQQQMVVSRNCTARHGACEPAAGPDKQENLRCDLQKPKHKPQGPGNWGALNVGFAHPPSQLHFWADTSHKSPRLSTREIQSHAIRNEGIEWQAFKETSSLCTVSKFPKMHKQPVVSQNHMMVLHLSWTIHRFSM